MSSHPTFPQALPPEPAALIEYILDCFHEIHRQQMPDLIRLATQVESVQAGHPAAPHGVAALLKSMHAELLQHMDKEESILFPMLARGGSAFVVHPIGFMRTEHVEHTENLVRLMALTNNARPPEDACRTWCQLCIGVKQFADDSKQHIRIENDVLIPHFQAVKR